MASSEKRQSHRWRVKSRSMPTGSVVQETLEFAYALRGSGDALICALRKTLYWQNPARSLPRLRTGQIASKNGFWRRVPLP